MAFTGSLYLTMLLIIQCSMGSDFSEPRGPECSLKLVERLTRLEIDNENLKQKVAKLGSESSDVIVKFRVSKQISVANGQKIKYDVAMRNDGLAFNVEESVFKAPQDGVYIVSLTVCVDVNKWVVTEVLHEGAVTSQFLSGDNGYHTCNNEVLTQSLRKGERLWVQKLRGSASVLFEGYGWNTFSVSLLK
uniref:Sialic acid binding lectin n=1 Tax=Solen grandis TaxID=165599 RepID=H6USP3_9BIVA|nr:sialic acid binding lectin [Solen grandis]